MASIVTCPGCQKRLKLGADKPGGKLRCPACNTPFVLGSRINEDAGGPAEFQAFELFEEFVETQDFEVIEERPAKQPMAAKPASPKAAPAAPRAEPKAVPPATVAKTAPRTAPLPPTPASKADDNVIPESAAPVREAPAPPPPSPPPAPPESKPAPPAVEREESEEQERQEESILPDEFTGLSEEWAHTIKTAPAAPPKIESAAGPKSTPKPAPKPEEFFLPANLDLAAFAAPAKSGPLLNLSLDDDVKLQGEPVEEFEIIDTSPHMSADGVPIIEGATDDEIQAAVPRQDYEEITDADYQPRNRAERRQRRMMKRAVRQALNAEVRGRWAMVFWGITFELAATVCFGIALILVVVSMAVTFLGAIVGSGPLIGIAGLISLLILGLTALSGVLDLIGRGLSIPCPAKNNAMIWAIISAALGLAGVIGLLPLTLIGQILYLVFLKFAADALKEHSLAEECMVLIKLVIITALISFFLFIFVFAAYILGVATVARTHDPADAGTLGWVMFALALIFIVIELILCAVVTYKYFEILTEFRHELRWRLES